MVSPACADEESDDDGGGDDGVLTLTDSGGTCTTPEHVVRDSGHDVIDVIDVIDIIDAIGLDDDFASMRFEEPESLGSSYNDIHTGGFESENWTGNISFDDVGNPISGNARFIDDPDADAADRPVCPSASGCGAPWLRGTCVQERGATRWSSTRASVNPGGDITVVFEIVHL